MAKWIMLDQPRDFQHASRAITAFKGGVAYYQPDHIADPLIELGHAREVSKPENRDGKPRSEVMKLTDD